QYNSGTDTTSIVDHLKYDSFGNITSQSNSAFQPLFGYTGQLFDKDTGLQYNLARWYDPHLGRFVSQDPSGFAAGDPNLYRYVTNSPPNFTDPTGRYAEGYGSGGTMYSGSGAAVTQTYYSGAQFNSGSGSGGPQYYFGRPVYAEVVGSGPTGSG